MKLKKFIEQTQPFLELELKNLVNQEIPLAYSGVREMLAYQMGWEGEGNGASAQGKRIRPQMVLLSTHVFSENWQTALPAAASIELLHNFSLIHDDIEDQSELRRGRPTVWKQWGIAQSINAGDAMFTLAQIAMLKLEKSLSPSITLEAAKLLNQTCVLLTGGQYLDMDFESRDLVREPEYMEMITGKTAALLSTAMELGAIIGEADEVQRQAAKNFGFYLGIAFQVWDDWLGIWGNEIITGKSTSSDLKTHKKTIPVLYAMENGREFALTSSDSIYNDEDIRKLVVALENDGAKEYTENLAQKYSDRALESLDAMNIQEEQAKQILIELTDRLLNRIN